jgi:hypothetical protein
MATIHFIPYNPTEDGVFTKYIYFGTEAPLVGDIVGRITKEITIEDAWVGKEECIFLSKDEQTVSFVANSNYVPNRFSAYPEITDQLDMLFHDTVNGTTIWKDTIQAIKDANPKPVE